MNLKASYGDTLEAISKANIVATLETFNTAATTAITTVTTALATTAATAEATAASAYFTTPSF